MLCDLNVSDFGHYAVNWNVTTVGSTTFLAASIIFFPNGDLHW